MDDGMVYTASFPLTAVTAQMDFFEGLCPTDSVLCLHEVHIGQETEAGDTEAELLGYKIVKGLGAVTSGSGGITAASGKKMTGYPASGATVEAVNTTKMVVGSGTLEIWTEDTFHVAAGLHYVPTPEDRPKVSPGDRITVELAKTPADSISFRGYMKYSLIGG